MFEDVSGFGAWQRLFFKLEGGILYYWNYPNEIGNKVGNDNSDLSESFKSYHLPEIFYFSVSSIVFSFIIVYCSLLSQQRAASLCGALTA